VIWPISAPDIALLRAALLDGGAAIDSYREWRSLVDIDGRLDNGQFRLLPMVYANMSRLGHEDSIMPRLRGVYRQSWVRGRQHLAAAEQTLRLLEVAGVPAMVTKGVALSATYYRTPTLRPMDDIDVLVQRSRLDDARKVLGASGWRSSKLDEYAQNGSLAAFTATRPGIDLRDRSGRVVDLHWAPLHECSHQAFVEWFWRRAEKISIETLSGLRPAPACLLLHVISHGLRPGGTSHLQWALDATMILSRSAVEIDWGEFWAMARRAGIEMRVSEGLRRLREVSPIALPQGACCRARWSLIELLERPSLSRERGQKIAVLPSRLLFLANTLRVARDSDVKTFVGASRLKVRNSWDRRRRG